MGKGGELQQSEKKLRKITVEELSKHRTPADAWMSFEGKVYDVSNWEEHPGGSAIFTHAGEDFTDIFAAFHPPSARNLLEKYQIGVLDESVLPPGFLANKLEPAKQKVFEAAYRQLRNRLIREGYFEASKLYYAFKFFSTVALLVASVYFAWWNNAVGTAIGALFLALFWQQCGWLAHDFLHHQVFKTRVYGDMVGLIVGDLFQGFSVHWWKNKHNSHHAVPNLLASQPGACDGDPDIDTMPFLAWTLRMAESARDSKWGRFFVNYQAIFYFPLLLLARFAWAHQSWVYIWGGWGAHSVQAAEMDKRHIQYPKTEKTFLVLHYAFFLYVMSQMSLGLAVTYFVSAQLMCGLFLALVFGLGHNAMAAYHAEERPDFWKLQVSTTRNVKSTIFVDWFFGGLQYQVDHHLFPSLPRHNFGKVHKLVEEFCKEHGVTYHETNIWDGTVEVLKHLSTVSKEFIKEFPGM